MFFFFFTFLSIKPVFLIELITNQVCAAQRGETLINLSSGKMDKNISLQASEFHLQVK